MQIFPNIYLMSGFAYQRHQNFYGIDIPKENRLVLVDCGLDENDLAVMESVKKAWNLKERKISDVFVTHAHFDHSGNAYWFEQRGSRISAGEDGKSLLSGDEHTIDFAYQRAFPICRNVKILKDQETIVLAPGYTMKCHFSPGHTRGSVCYELLYGDKHIWFTGDMVQTGEEIGQVRIGIKVDSGYDYEQYRESMKKMKNAVCDAVLPGHYEPYLCSGSGLFQIAYRELLANRDKYR